MTIERKVGMGIAGQPTGGAVNVADVFSTYLYDGTGATKTITNGIDLSGEGGMVWVKDRVTAVSHHIFDTERGVGVPISSNNTAGNDPDSGLLTGFNSNGFNLGGSYKVNANTKKFASWTFRKAPKFFDVVTYTGNGVAGREIAHGLGSVPAMIILKRTDSTGHWLVYHHSLSNQGDMIRLNWPSAVDSSAPLVWGSTPFTDTTFSVNDYTENNGNGATYVAYLFADNTAEGADDQMIKCGSFLTDGSGLATVNLGWEPQYILFKNADNAGEWVIADTMRGLSHSGYNLLYANLSNAEGVGTSASIVPTSTGFQLLSNAFNSNDNIIYMAIRAPMMVEPDSGTEVFAVDAFDTTTTSPAVISGFPVDLVIRPAITTQGVLVASRLTGTGYMWTNDTNAEVSYSDHTWDYMNGCLTAAINSDFFAYMFKRAKGFFDVVAYTGNGTAGHTINHSLGVVPEMIWVKKRDASANWQTYNAALGATHTTPLDATDAPMDLPYFWNDTTPTDSVFTLGFGGGVNGSGGSYIAYLFASLDGISKVGSYTGNGSSQTINCGFAAGARFILIRRTDSSGDWYFWDTARGIVAGNDPHLSLNTVVAQVSDDSVDPANSGFIVNQVAATNINVSSGTYIFYAIA